MSHPFRGLAVSAAALAAVYAGIACAPPARVGAQPGDIADAAFVRAHAEALNDYSENGNAECRRAVASAVRRAGRNAAALRAEQSYAPELRGCLAPYSSAA